MAAFDVTTKPTSLSLKPGSTGSIMVVVSNRLGRPVMGSVEGVMTPATAAGWLVPPPNAQRPYPADPSATVTHEFKIAVPVDAPAQVAHFRASARDVLLPDDTRSDGQTVAIDITRDPVEEKKRKPWPWWIWVILAVVVLAAAAVGIWLALKPDKTLVPNVVGKPPAEATTMLMDAGFDSVTVKDTVAGTGQDTNKVTRQDPLADTEVPRARSGESVLATIVVSRPPGLVPLVVNMRESEAVKILRAAGFGLIEIRDTIAPKSFLVDLDRVFVQSPKARTPLPPESMRGQTPATIWIKRATTVVPDVVGKREAVAINLLREAGLHVGTTSLRAQIFIPSGMILEAKPAAGKVVRQGSAVDLVISR